MANTLPPEKWGLKESADWWSAGQASRQQIYGVATEMMLELANVQPGSRVLDVAAGTGDQTLMAARRVGPTGNVLATDDSASMLKVAAEAARKEGLTNVDTRVMNAEDLELDADSFDAVICRNALMLFAKPAKALTEMRRVVKPGSKVAVIVFSAAERNPHHGIPFAIIRRVGNIPPPAPGEPWMYALGDPRALEDVYERAGFLNVSVHAVPIQRRFASTAEAIERMRNSAGDLRELVSRLNEAERERAWVEIEEQLRRFEGPNGLEVPGEVLIGVGTK
ncbi:MAG TPA: methyltransferase domain-containing protein [Candidatus Binatia bacterium]|jgi:ubiquinone/menaquinone biosynthesis C-methylase UbiE